ncbi:MAG: cation:dicarboxylase symporter family transporter [Nibricoccus sp.]
MENISSEQPVARGKPWYRLTMTQQILLALVLGTLLGWWINAHFDVTGLTGADKDAVVAQKNRWLEWVMLPRDIFLHLIKAMIAPLIFGSVVQGIAGTGDLKRVGRIGVKAILYFEIVTTAALAIGLLMVNVVKPGAGIVLQGVEVGALGSAAQTKPLTLVQTLLHVFPTSVIDAMARGDVLQIVSFSVLFALAVIAAGEAGRPMLNWCESLTQVMFKFAGIVMLAAPLGVGAAVAVTVGHQGLGVLVNLGKLVFTLYAALAVFVIVVLGLVIRIARVPLRPFVRAMREPFTIAFATANSESALPKAFALMEKFGVPRGIVGFVLPAGYTFNLDGSTLHLAVASVFVAQAAEATSGLHFGIGQQILLMLTLMVTSKGVAAVPRASLIVLLAALSSFGLPLEGAAVIFAVDELLDMARTSVNVLGNCLASVVVARWEGEFDDAKAHANFGTPALATKSEDDAA